ncbi:MAG: CBS domain-containing protein [Frankiaceae bacterium]|nr:CBS domain-containing protein [Frankiaceae bacterium]
MRAPDFMTRPVITVSPDATVKEAARLLVRHGVSAVPVVDDAGRVLGIVSELDLLAGEVPGDPVAHLAPVAADTTLPLRLVREVMTANVVGLPEDADAAAFAEVMRTSGFKSVPVLRGDRVVGIVSRRDLLRAVARDDADIRDDVLTRIRAYGGDIADCGVHVDNGIVSIQPASSDPADAKIAVLLARGVPGAVRVVLLSAPS